MGGGKKRISDLWPPPGTHALWLCCQIKGNTTLSPLLNLAGVHRDPMLGFTELYGSQPQVGILNDKSLMSDTFYIMGLI